MFDEYQGQAQATDQTNTNTSSSTGLGVNPTPTLSGVSDLAAPAPTVPQVVLPDPALQQQQDQPDVASSTEDNSGSLNSDLQDIKRHALEQLSPLVHQLEQTPEEKYKTLMMMIQASDNQGLIGEAYAAAQAISDEKAKAEALLNIVNEINYFTTKV